MKKALKNWAVTVFLALSVIVMTDGGALPPAQAQEFHSGRPDTAKKCAICHFEWTYAFFYQKRNGELIPRPTENEVASVAMCLSCHDGSVQDSRSSAFLGPGHRSGIVPSENVTIPEEFPLDDEGRLHCFTCHTPHAVSSEGSDTHGLYLRDDNTGSSLCKRCHANKSTGPEKGNHSVDVSAPSKSQEILDSGGRYGEAMPNQVICETCHVAHGSHHRKFLVLSSEDNTRSVLCIACHGDNPLSTGKDNRGPGSHPVNVKPQKVVYPPRWSNSANVATGLQGEIVCRTCHTPHGAMDKEKLLTEHNYKDSMCIQCHSDNRKIQGSKHDLRVLAPDEKNIRGVAAKWLGPCSPCHLPHGGGEKLMWARQKPMEEVEGEYCSYCHSPGGSAEKRVPRDYSHPMDVHIESMSYARSKMSIACSTCHSFHDPAPFYEDAQGERHGRFLLHSERGASGICLECHKRYAMIEGTDHDLRISAPGFKNVNGQSPSEAGVCSPCHVAHNATHEKYLWSAPMGPALLEGWEPKNSAKNDIMIMLCTGCHAPGEVAEKQVPEFGLHPRGFLVPDEDLAPGKSEVTFERVKGDFPIYRTTGEVALSGSIVCSTCHGPHQWDPRVEGKGPGRDVEGDATNSFLRKNLHAKFCTECHGEDSLIKFKYFHSQEGREKDRPFEIE